MSKKVAAAVSHHDREVAELRADRELAVEYLKAAMESLDDPDNRDASALDVAGQLGGFIQPQHIGGLAYGSFVPEQWASPNRAVDFF